MSSILLTGPAVEPLSLDDARSFLRVEHGDDDPLIAVLIVGARMHVEGQGKTAMMCRKTGASCSIAGSKADM